MTQPSGMTIAGGITLTSGMTLTTSGGSTPPGSNGNGVINYADMGPPIIPGQQLQDGNATVNGTTGFTINTTGSSGVATLSLSVASQTYFNNLGLGTHTATFGPGSTYASATINVVALPDGSGGGGPGGAGLVFFINPTLSYPATFNFPITIS
jgi:hypothetical protein